MAGSRKYRLLFTLLSMIMATGSVAQMPDRLEISYFGNNIWNEGLQISFTWSRESTSEKKQKFYEAALGGFNDTDAYTAVFLHGGFRQRSNRKLGFTKAFYPLGIYRSFLPETFEMQEDASIKKLFLPGRFYYAPAAEIGLSLRPEKRPENLYSLSLNGMLLMPYNTYVMPLLNLKLSYSFSLKKS